MNAQERLTYKADNKLLRVHEIFRYSRSVHGDSTPYAIS